LFQKFLRSRRKLVVLLAIFCLCGAATWLWVSLANRNALWEIVQHKCLIETESTPQPPCLYARKDQGFAIMRDRKGGEHFLLLPTSKIAGIEAPVLLRAETPNFFASALTESGTLEKEFGAAFGAKAMLLAVNSQGGRSQDQLHVHISCLSPQADAILKTLSTTSPEKKWKELAQPIAGHSYILRRTDLAELSEETPFRILANEVEAAIDQMGLWGVALVRLPSNQYFLLATKRHLMDLNFASPEELQNHDCS
jgi:CDP-diacylglycerol pyrophosphatase